MRLDWLEDLVALLDCGSITAAAKARNVSQPAFSRRIKMAEDALGCTLLDRGQKPARLLPTVAVMAPRLRSAAIEIRQLRVDLRLAASAEARGLVITSQHSLATTRAAAIVEQLDDVNGVRGVRLRAANRDDCGRMLMIGDADIAIVHRRPAEQVWHRPSEIVVAGLSAERLIPIATPQEAAKLAERTERSVAYPAEVFLGEVFAAAIAPRLAAGLTLRPRAETALAPAAHALAREGAGVAWVPESIARFDLACGFLLDLSGSLPSTLLELIAIRTKRPRSDAHAAAWDRLVNGQALGTS